jgi:hypothetical protein
MNAKTNRWIRARAARGFLPVALLGVFGVTACGGSAHVSTRSSEDGRQPATLGSLTGQLIMVGGTTADNGPRPVPGTVEVIQDGRTFATVTVAASGRFTATLPRGAYVVKACTPKIQTVEPGGVHEDACGTPVHATVVPLKTTPVDLAAFVVP